MKWVVEHHTRSKRLYYRTITRAELAAYELAYGQMYMTVDGIERSTDGWQPWAVATAIDTLVQWGTIF